MLTRGRCSPIGISNSGHDPQSSSGAERLWTSAMGCVAVLPMSATPGWRGSTDAHNLRVEFDDRCCYASVLTEMWLAEVTPRGGTMALGAAMWQG